MDRFDYRSGWEVTNLNEVLVQAGLASRPQAPTQLMSNPRAPRKGSRSPRSSNATWRIATARVICPYVLTAIEFGGPGLAMPCPGHAIRCYETDRSSVRCRSLLVGFQHESCDLGTQFEVSDVSEDLMSQVASPVDQKQRRCTPHVICRHRLRYRRATRRLLVHTDRELNLILMQKCLQSGCRHRIVVFENGV